MKWFPNLKKKSIVPDNVDNYADDIKKMNRDKDIDLDGEKKKTSDADLKGSQKGTGTEAEIDDRELANGVAKYPNWVEVLNIRNIVNAKTPHVLRMDINASNTGFTGCHSKIALDDYVSNHPTSTYEFRSKVLDPSNNEVYEAKPILTLENGVELGKVNNGGVSSFFPNNWDEAKILDEVEFAIANNHGKIPSKPNGNEYYGFSTDVTVEIHFYLKQNGTLGSYFPFKN